MENDRVTEILLALVFVILLILIIFLVIETSNDKNSTTITNSYNTYTTNYPTQKTPVQYTEKYYYDRDYSDKHYYIKYYDDDKNYYRDYDYLEFSSWRDHETVEGIFDDEIHRYYVYVTNEDNKAGYFTVKFYFYRDGKKSTESATHYIKPDQEKKFFQQTVLDEYDSWNYKILSKTRK